MGRSRSLVVASVLLLASCGGSSPSDPGRGVPVYGPCGLRPNYVDEVLLNRWPAFPLTYFFDSASFTADFREEYRSAIAEGLRRWNVASGSELGSLVEVDDPGSADFQVIFGIVAAPQVPAQTIHRTGTPFLSGGVIGFNAPFMEEGEALVRAGELSREAFVRVVARVAAHEVGHLMGIIGHPDDDDTLMGPSPLTLERPTVEDVNTLIHAYCR